MFLVKAFDRVPRELLWSVLAKFGVPPKLIRLLQSLHAHVEVKFTVNEVTQTIECIIGVKQGDILGPILFTFYLAAIMITWRAVHSRPLCVFRSNPDFILTGRSFRARGENFEIPGSEYADDMAVLFISRENLEDTTPRMIEHFARFGMDIHVGSEGKPSKTEVLFVAAPEKLYDEPEVYDGRDLTNVVLGNGSFFPVVEKFRYLGTMLTRTCRDDVNVAERIKTAGNAFGALHLTKYLLCCEESRLHRDHSEDLTVRERVLVSD